MKVKSLPSWEREHSHTTSIEHQSRSKCKDAYFYIYFFTINSRIYNIQNPSQQTKDRQTVGYQEAVVVNFVTLTEFKLSRDDVRSVSVSASVSASASASDPIAANSTTSGLVKLPNTTTPVFCCVPTLVKCWMCLEEERARIALNEIPVTMSVWNRYRFTVTASRGGVRKGYLRCLIQGIEHCFWQRLQWTWWQHKSYRTSPILQWCEWRCVDGSFDRVVQSDLKILESASLLSRYAISI